VLDRLRIGRSLRAIRIRSGLRQVDVAARARVSRAFVSKLERGAFRSTDLARVEAVCAALGADLDVRVRWRGEGLDRLLDEGHAALVDRIVAMLRTEGWEVALEVTFNDFGDRGSIDVFACHPREQHLLVAEVKSVVADAQGTLAPLDRKVRVAPKLARERDWTAIQVSRLLVVAEGSTNRRRTERFGALFDAALPDRGWQVRRWLGAPDRPLNGLLFLSDAPRGSVRRTTAGRSRVRRRRPA
jgi:transcriptional regulator with XRE-family HTH domain